MNPHTSDFLIQICIHYSSDHVAVNRGSSNANIANITVTQAHMSQGILASKCASIQISISLKIPSTLILFSFFFLPSLHFLFMYQHSSFGVIYILFKVFIKMQNIYFFSPLFFISDSTPPPPPPSILQIPWQLRISFTHKAPCLIHVHTLPLSPSTPNSSSTVLPITFKRTIIWDTNSVILHPANRDCAYHTALVVLGVY